MESEHPPPKPSKIAADEGRKRLKIARFVYEESVLCGGSGEVWFNRFNVPVFVSYFAGDKNFFSLESLEKVLAMTDDKL